MQDPLWLVGMMGAGRSSVGGASAARLDIVALEIGALVATRTSRLRSAS